MRTTSGRWSAFARLVTFTSALLASTSQAFVEVPFNKQQHYGPDGPWQAISLGVRYTGDVSFTTVDLYPSVMYDTIAALYVPTTKVCSKSSYSGCAAGGTLGPLSNVSSHSWYTYFDTATSFYFYLNGSTSYTDIQFPNAITMSSAITDVLTIGEMTYPSGNTVPIDVGYAGLGGSPLTQAENPPLSLYTGGLTQSNSYGLHIGAAALGYTGSLIFGGYNRGRVIGPVITYDAHGSLSLIDVEIGVETGGSPFNFATQAGLMTIPSSSGYTGSIPALVKPEYPYIYLNQQTIDNIVKYLPVTFDSTAGFYLWDTSNPSYKQIVNSPAYLAFVFPSLSGNTANIKIKVPFKLLNMTLEAAASGLPSDRAYLPFMATDIGGNTGSDILFGRAFLQAAFMGTNWGHNTSFLAQAPGPGAAGEGLGIDPVDLAQSATALNVQQGNTLFQQSWAKHWTPLSGSSNNGGGSGSGSSGLSGGAIGGIVGGVVGGLLIIGAIIALILILRKRKARRAAAQQPEYAQPGYAQPGYAPPGQAAPHSPGQPAFHYTDKQQEPTHEMHGDPSYRQELDSQGYYNKQYQKPEQDQYQMSSNIQHVSELPGHDPQELPANYRTQ